MKCLTKNIGLVGVLLGGKSKERAISLRSGNAIYRALRKQGVSVSKIDPTNGFFRNPHQKRRIDVFFPALHGQGGEDGSIQKILERMRIPYVGSRPKPSASAFDKVKAKDIFLRHRIPTPPYDILTERNWKSVWNIGLRTRRAPVRCLFDPRRL